MGRRRVRQLKTSQVWLVWVEVLKRLRNVLFKEDREKEKGGLIEG